MNVAVCILVFLYINYWGWKYITSKQTFEKVSPWNPREKITFTGPEMFLLLTLSCAIIAAAPFGLLPIRLLLWEIFLLLGFSKVKLSFGFCAFLYSLYILFILISLNWSPAPFYGFRVFLKYLLPFLILLVVPGIIKNEKVFASGVKGICKVLSFYFATYGFGVIGLGILLYPISGMWWWGPAICDTYSVFLPLCVIASKIFSNKKYLWLIVAMCVAPLIGYVVRTGLVALFISSVAMAAFHYRIKAVPYLFILVIIAFLSVIYIPQLRAKMFLPQYATEEYAMDYANWKWDAVESNGRFSMWDDCLQRYYTPKPWIGSGAGSEQNYLYQKMFKGLGAGICHCDYVQILCDNGLIGIILYGVSILCLIIHCFFMYNNYSLPLYCRYSSFIAGTGMCGMAAAMMTDNVVNYTMCTLVFPFMFYAMALGLKTIGSIGVENVQRNHSAL